MLYNRGVLSPVGPGYFRVNREGDIPDPDPDPSPDMVMLAKYVIDPQQVDHGDYFLNNMGGDKFYYDSDMQMVVSGAGTSYLQIYITAYDYREWDEWEDNKLENLGDVGSISLEYTHPGVGAPFLVSIFHRLYEWTGGYRYDDDGWYEEDWHSDDANQIEYVFSGPLVVDFQHLLVADAEMRMGDFVIPFRAEGVIPLTETPPPFQVGDTVEVWGRLEPTFTPGTINIGYTIPVPGHGADASGAAFIHGVTLLPRMDGLSPALVRSPTKQICRVMDGSQDEEFDNFGSKTTPDAAITAVLTEAGEVWTARVGMPPVLRDSGIRHLTVGNHRWGSSATPGAVFLAITYTGTVRAISTSGEYPGGINNIPAALTAGGADAVAIAGASPRRGASGFGAEESLDLFCALTASGTVHVWGNYATENGWVQQYTVPNATSLTICPHTVMISPPRPAIVVVQEGGQIALLDGGGDITYGVAGVKEYGMNYPSWAGFRPAEMFLREDGAVIYSPLSGAPRVMHLGLAHLTADGGIRPNGEYVRIPAPEEPGGSGIAPERAVFLSSVPFRTGVPARIPSYVPLSSTVDRSWYQPMGGPGYESPVPSHARTCIAGNGPLFVHADENGALVFTDVSQYVFGVTLLPIASTLDSAGARWGVGPKSARNRNYIEGIVSFQARSGPKVLYNEWGALAGNRDWNHLHLSDVFHLYDGRIVSTTVNGRDSEAEASPTTIQTSTRYAAGLFYLTPEGGIEKLLESSEVPVPPILGPGDVVLDMVGEDHSELGASIRLYYEGFSHQESWYRGQGYHPVVASFLIQRAHGPREVVTVDFTAGLRRWGEGDSGVSSAAATKFVQVVDAAVTNLGQMITMLNFHIKAHRSPIADQKYYLGTDYMGTHMTRPYQPTIYAKDTLGRFREFNTIRRKDLSLRNTPWDNREVFHSLMSASAWASWGDRYTPGNVWSMYTPSGDATGGIVLPDRTHVRLDTVWGDGGETQSERFGSPRVLTPVGGGDIDFGKPLLWCTAGQVQYTPMPPLESTPIPGGLFYEVDKETGYYVVTALGDDGSVMSVGVKTRTIIQRPAGATGNDAEIFAWWVVETPVKEIYPPGSVNTNIITGMKPQPLQHWGHRWGRKFGG